MEINKEAIDYIEDNIKMILRESDHGKIMWNYRTFIDALEWVKSLIESDKEGATTMLKKCPTCARNARRFELINYPVKYMCDGCALTRGIDLGEWNKIFEKLTRPDRFIYGGE